MFKLTKNSFILLLISSVEVNESIELLEKVIHQQKEEFDFRLNNATKMQEIYERRIDEIAKQILGFNEKLKNIFKSLLSSVIWNGPKANSHSYQSINQLFIVYFFTIFFYTFLNNCPNI
jgi:predicted PurR-regulated permease PerM